MRGEPGAAEMLRTARETLKSEVLPALKGGERYAALMIANALGMVERELAAKGRLRAAEDAVAAFGRGPWKDAGDERGDDGAGRTRALCAAIRDGRHDGDEGLYAALHAQAIGAVAVTRPSALTEAERRHVERETNDGESSHEQRGRP